MNENKILLKKQKSFAINSRATNRYLNYENDNSINNLYTQNYNNPYQEENNNFNIYENKIYNAYDTNSKIDNIHKYKSTDNKYRNQTDFDINDNLKKENICLHTSLSKLQKNYKLKDIEIYKYKKNINSLIKCIKKKDYEINLKNKLLSAFYDEQEVRKMMNENENNNINLLSLSNYKLQKYKQKAEELNNKINEQRNYFLTERKKLFKYINKIQNDNKKIREDSVEKDIKIKTLINFRKNINNSPVKNNTSNNFYNQMQLKSPNNNSNNKNNITKNYFTIKNKIYNAMGNNNNYDNNKLINSYRQLEIQKNETDKKLLSKENMINTLLKRINILQKKISIQNASNLKYNNNKLKIVNCHFTFTNEEIIKAKENDNNNLNKELNELKIKYNSLSNESEKNNVNNEKLLKEKGEIIKDLENNNIKLTKEISEIKLKYDDLISKEEEKIKNYQETNKKLTRELNELKNKCDGLFLSKEETIKNSEIKIEELKAKYEKLLLLKEEEKMKNSEKSNKKFENELEELKAKYDNIISIKEKIINNSENSNKELKNQIEELKAKYDKLLSADLKKQKNLKELLNKINLYEKTINEHNEVISALNDELKKLHEEVKLYESKNSNLVKNEEYINDLKDKIEKMNYEYKRLEINFGRLKDELNKIQNLRIDDINKINQFNKNLQNSKEENNKLNNQNLELKERIKTIEESNKKQYNEIKTENDNLNKVNSQLNENLTKLNEQLKSLISKNQENEKTLKEKEIEIKNLEDVSRALIDKQKNYLEEKDKDEQISPDTHYIISKKTYNKLTWYLVSTCNPNDKSISKDKINNYNNYKWVTELIIPKNQIDKYKGFKEDEPANANIKNNSYIKNLRSQLEQKEKELNSLKKKNKTLNEKNQNKSTSVKDKRLFLGKFTENDDKFQLNKSKSNKNIINTENLHNDENSLINRITNYYDNRELDYKEKISRLETQIRNTEDFQLKTNDIKGISIENESDFIDFNVSAGDNMIKFLKEKNILKKKNNDDEDILTDIPGNDSYLDEVKGLQELIQYLKKDNKEKDKKFNNLSQKVEELIKNLNHDNKINSEVSEILKLIGYSSDKIEKIINDKKG